MCLFCFRRADDLHILYITCPSLSKYLKIENGTDCNGYVNHSPRGKYFLKKFRHDGEKRKGKHTDSKGKTQT